MAKKPAGAAAAKADAADGAGPAIRPDAQYVARFKETARHRSTTFYRERDYTLSGRLLEKLIASVETYKEA